MLIRNCCKAERGFRLRSFIFLAFLCVFEENKEKFFFRFLKKIFFSLKIFLVFFSRKFFFQKKLFFIFIIFEQINLILSLQKKLNKKQNLIKFPCQVQNVQKKATLQNHHTRRLRVFSKFSPLSNAILLVISVGKTSLMNQSIKILKISA